MRRSILFVDDETRILDGLVRMLRPQRERIEVVTAPGGPEALAVLAGRGVDAVVSDMRMPRMDGAALLAEVRRLHPFPVRIILSGQSDQETILRAVATTHQFLSKPCDPGQLVDTVLRACAWRDRGLGDDGLQAAVSRCATLPAPPATIARLDAELAADQPSPRRVAALVAADPAMAAKALQLVSSSFFGQPRQVGPDEAVRLLGIDLVRALHRHGSLAAPAAGGEDPAPAIAARARALCLHLGGDERLACAAAIAGLLHGCGGLLGAGTGAAPAVGASLLGLWGLPAAVPEAVLHQRRPAAAGEAAGCAAGALHAALALAGRIPWDEEWLAARGGADALPELRRTADAITALPPGGA